jgi:pyruvate, water dikinase
VLTGALATLADSARRARTPVHVYALLADMDHYRELLPAAGFMMCTAELRCLANRQQRSAGWFQWTVASCE